MFKHGRFSHRINVWVDNELADKLKAESSRRKLSVAMLVRDTLYQVLTEGAAVEGREALDKAIRRAIKPDIDRLAKMLSRSTVAGATAMYMNVQAIADLGKNDAVELYEAARKKAVAYLRDPGENG